MLRIRHGVARPGPGLYVRGHRGEGEAGLRGLRRVLLTQHKHLVTNAMQFDLMTRRGQGQDTETTITIHRTNRTNSALSNLSIALMFNLTTNLLCHK